MKKEKKIKRVYEFDIKNKHTESKSHQEITATCESDARKKAEAAYHCYFVTNLKLKNK